MYRVQLHISAQYAKPVEELLLASGALSLSLQDDADNPLYEPPPGSAPLWPTLEVSALYQSRPEQSLLHKALENLVGGSVELSVIEFEDHDWQANFQQQITPQRFGQRLWVYPSWHDDPAPDGISIKLDPGLAFGTGSHATTDLCLTWLDYNTVAGLKVLDFGSGSGILSVAACKLDAAHLYAVDIDPQAITATRENLIHNDIPEDKFSIDFPAQLQTVKTDIILANILCNPLKSLHGQFQQQLLSGGTLVMSGILEQQVEEICAIYQTGFSLVETKSKDGWALVAVTRD